MFGLFLWALCTSSLSVHVLWDTDTSGYNNFRTETINRLTWTDSKFFFIIFLNQGFVFLILLPLAIVVTVCHGCLLGNTSFQDACILMSLVLLYFSCSSLTTSLLRDNRKINRGMTFTWAEFALKAKNNIGNVLSWGYGSTYPDRTEALLLTHFCTLLFAWLVVPRRHVKQISRNEKKKKLLSNKITQVSFN